jgi:hypothetical protein
MSLPLHLGFPAIRFYNLGPCKRANKLYFAKKICERQKSAKTTDKNIDRQWSG